MSESVVPPVAERRSHEVTRHGETFDDPWFWLREREDPAVRAHLEAENAYTDAHLGPLEPLIDRVFDEIRQRVQETDASVPSLDGGWLYYRRTLEGQQYGIRCRRPAPEGVGDVRELPDERRRPVDPTAPPEDEVVLLDENVEAAAHDFFRLGGYAVSPDHRLAAELVDTDGSERFTIRVRDLATGELLDDRIEGVAYSLAWFGDSQTFLYAVPDDAWRPFQIKRHRLGTDPATDELLHQEDDERFWCGVGRTRSERFLAISVGSKVTSEWYLLDADDASAAPRLVAEREHGVEYDLDHRGDQLLIVTNADGAEDFKLVTAPVASPGREHWTELVGHRAGVRLEGVEAFASHLVLHERTQARTQLRVVDPTTGDGEVLAMDEEVYTAATASNPSFDTRVLRLAYTSMTTPTQVIDLDLDTGERVVLKQQPVRGGYDRDQYVSWREWATAADGTRVPISLVRRVDTALDGTAPCLLYGYGSYEISIDPGFSPVRLSLLDRGFVFAIAHVRGGGELGRRWYEDGKFLAKPNTFADFVACADHLVGQAITARDRLAVRGGSAGGMLIGAALNLRPDLAAAAVAEVPFVDVVNTMSDPSIPLTVIEYDEWGNPEDPAYHEVMRSYSPYDNVQAAEYPAMFVTAGLNDPRVQYWEPAKWVAKLRTTATGGGPILLHTELGAGHAGRSGRYDAWRDEARVLAFVIDRVHPDVAPVTDEPA
ncbi:S9 family peptidase [Egicoccus halophilus]|uniref:Oligopeptidase B n=1 Tax=Egicoccus halophilus TaxID=1670830 RepID=A0A8J3AEM8_9ACTN|nr:S9 family peptidase [Egicoccus halophilus]GGI06444.1 oligopeptidase B [Egicoccus halophilus]